MGKQNLTLAERKLHWVVPAGLSLSHCCTALFHHSYLISVFSRPFFGSVTPAWDFLPAPLTGECPQPGLTPPGKFHCAEKVQGATLMPLSSSTLLPLTCHNIPVPFLLTRAKRQVVCEPLQQRCPVGTQPGAVRNLWGVV